MKTHAVLMCRKCYHEVFMSLMEWDANAIKKLLKLECPACGEEPYDLWIFSRLGNYDKEHGVPQLPKRSRADRPC